MTALGALIRRDIKIALRVGGGREAAAGVGEREVGVEVAHGGPGEVQHAQCGHVSPPPARRACRC